MSYRLERIGTFLAPNPENDWEKGGTFNPSLLYDLKKDQILFTYRAVPVSGYQKGDFKPFRYLSSVGYGSLEIDFETLDFNCQRSAKPLLIPDQIYERGMGCEDARLTKINDLYLLPYTASGFSEEGIGNVRIGLATSEDFLNWNKHGVIGPDEQTKATTIFEQENGKVGMFFTLWPDSPKSSVMYREFESVEEIVDSDSKKWEEFLRNYDEHVVFRPESGVRRGAEIGAPPIQTEDGLVLIFCPQNKTSEDRWDISAALLDRDNPRVVRSELPEPILQAEKEGEINAPICRNCVFPMGALKIDNTLLVSHGQGDTHAGLAVGNFSELMEELIKK